MNTQRRARGKISVALLLLAWGCAVYDQGLLSDQGGLSSGGTGAGTAADAGSGGGQDVSGAAGSLGSAGSAGVTAGTAAGGSETTTGGSDAAGGASNGLAGSAAGGEGGAAACVPESTGHFCKRLGKNCGTLGGLDNCGNAITDADCGTCLGLRMCAGAGQANVCGALTDPATGGIATASSVGSIGENGDKAFDFNLGTKWYSGDNTGSTGWLAYQFPGTTTHIVTSYSITSANDVPQRDPTDWQLQGSNNGATWVTVDTQKAVVFASRYQTNLYTCSNSTAYRWYRLFITANAGATSLQLAELVLYGT